MAQKEEKKSKAFGGGLGGLIGGGLGAAGMLAALRSPGFRSGFSSNSKIPAALTDALGASTGAVLGGTLGAGLGATDYFPKPGDEYSADNLITPSMSSLGSYVGGLGGLAAGSRAAMKLKPSKSMLLKALLMSTGGSLAGIGLGGYGGGKLGETLFAKED